MLSSHFSRFCNAGELVHSVEKNHICLECINQLYKNMKIRATQPFLKFDYIKNLDGIDIVTYARHECQKHGNFNRNISVNANKYPDHFNLGRDTQFVVVQ